MLKREPTRTLCVVLMPLCAWYCSEGSLESGAMQALEEGVEKCVGSESEIGAEPPPSCQFDEGTLSQVCVRAGAQGEIVESRRYASQDDFVEGSLSFGKPTHLGSTRVSAGVTVTTTLRYDELGRVARSIENSPRGQMIYEFSRYDALDRPLEAKLTGSALADPDCEGYGVSFAYDAERQLVSRHMQALSDGCSEPERVELGYSTLPSGVEHRLCP